MKSEEVSRPDVDGRLLEACQRGERDAFRVLFETYKDRVYTMALCFSGDETLAHDVTQEIFLTLFRRIRDFRGEAKFTTWLYRLVANACIDEHRKRRRLVPFAPEEHMTRLVTHNPQEQRMQSREVAEAVQAAVAHLRPKLRLPILLRYIEGLSYEEIGAALGCTTAAVATRLNRAHKLLARRLASLRGAMG